MKAIQILLVSMFMLSGCSLEQWLEKEHAEKEFKSMCNRYDLAICGDIDIVETDQTNSDGIYSVIHEMQYRYKKDDGDTFDYLEDKPALGDCEDYVITLIENNLRECNLKKNSTRWVFGTVDGTKHSWALIEIDGDTYLFDSSYIGGIKKEYAYNFHVFDEWFTIYSY